MQKRVVGNINELNEAARKSASEESANTAGADRDGCKANKTSFGRFKKFAVIIMLLIVSVFCAIGSADWIISQQEQLPGGSGSTFVYDKKTLQNYIALKGSDETEAAAKVAEAEEYASLQTETDSDDSAVADKFTVKKAAVSKKSAVSTYANGLESAIYGKSAIYNGKPIVAIKKTAGIDNAAADLPDDVLNGSLLTTYKPLTDGSVTEADLTEADFAEGATSGLPQNAGTYAILVKIKELEAYGYAVKIFTILPCPVTVDWSGVDFANGFTYDGTAHPVTAAAKIASSDNGNIEGNKVNANLSISITKDGAFAEEIKTAGNYVLTAASGNDNYYISSGETTSFTVARKEATATVTLSRTEIEFGNEVPTATIKYSGVISGDTLGTPEISFVGESGEYKKGSNVGTYTIGITGGLDNENYNITTALASFTVTPYKLNIKWSDTDFKYTGEAQEPEATIDNPITGLTAPTVTVKIYMMVNGVKTEVTAKSVGKYIAEASITDGNYSIVSGGTTEFTISRIQIAIPTSGDNMLEYTGSKLTYRPAGFDESTMTITGNDGSSKTEYAYKAEVSLKDSAYEWSDKTTDPKIFAWYIVPTLVKFDGILEKTYEEAKTGITLGANVFTNLVFKNGEKANTQATGAASTIKVTDGNGNDYTETSPNNVVKVGSTYKAEIKLVNNYCFDIQVDETANKCTFNRNGTTYIKYKTAKIGSTTYYTIEDAINFSESGDIVLASDSSGTTSYITTSFSKIGYYGGNSFTCGKNIIVPHANGKTTSETAPKDNKPSSTTKNVGSVLIVPEGISLTMNSATLDILAIVAMDGLVTCTTYNRGVVMNHGTIKVTGTINNGDTPNIKAYGYLKGTGNVIVTDGATAEDLFHIFDFKGGGNTYGIKKGAENYLPINAYSLHNISCSIKVYAGCIYNALYEIYMGNTWFTGRIPVVGKSDAPSALFKLSEGYIEKTAIPADSSTNKDLDTITGSNQLKGQKEDVKIYGTVVDGSITIRADLAGILSVDMTTGTNNPLPIPYMDIRVCKGGNLTLENSSYKFMPGSALLVDDGGYLTVGSNAKLVFYSVEDCAELEKPVTYKASKDAAASDYPYNYMTKYCVDKSDAYFEINSNNTSLEGYLSGKITTKNQDIKINIKNASADITVLNTMTVDAKTILGLVKYAEVTTRTASSARPMTATSNIMTDRNNYGEANFSTGEYTSYKIGNEYYWASSSILKTVTLLSDGKQYGDTITEIIGTTITLPTGLSKKHYAFGGWSDGSTVYNGSFTVPDSDVTLNAVWTPITYTINYEFWYNDQRLSDELTANIVNANPATFTYDKNITFERVSLKGYTFDKWYIDSEFGTSVSQTSDALKYIEDGSVTITLYGRFIEPAYTITYYVNNDEISAENLKNFVENLQFEYSSANTYISYLENGTAFSPAKIDINDSDTTKSKYFLGWYTDENCETPFSSLSDATKVNLYAKWGLKAQIVVVGNNGTKTIEGYYHYKEDSTFTFAEADISSIVASGYKFIGAIASSEYTITATNTDNPNNITVTGKVTATVPEVAAGSSNTAPQIKVTADIRKILTVDIAMSAGAKYRVGIWYTEYYSINTIFINLSSLYSIDKNNWQISNGTNILQNSKDKTNTYYILEGTNSIITTTINDVKPGVGWTTKTFEATGAKLETSGCTYTSSHSGSTSTFVFTITNNATIKWYDIQS